LGVQLPRGSLHCCVRSREYEYEGKVTFARCTQAELLPDEKWAIVEAELERRSQAKETGRKDLALSLERQYEGAEVILA